MKKQEFYRQCRMVKGDLQEDAWIPEQYAQLNKFLKLKTKDGWEDGWKVVLVGEARLSEQTLFERRDEHRHVPILSDGPS